jgi:hypothetical protein
MHGINLNLFHLFSSTPTLVDALIRGEPNVVVLQYLGCYRLIMWRIHRCWHIICTVLLAASGATLPEYSSCLVNLVYLVPLYGTAQVLTKLLTYPAVCLFFLCLLSKVL